MPAGFVLSGTFGAASGGGSSFPLVVADSGFVAGQTAALPSLLSYAVAATGLYRVSFMATTTAVAGGNNVNPDCVWTDDNDNAWDADNYFGNGNGWYDSGGQNTNDQVGPDAWPGIIIRAKAGTNIVVSTELGNSEAITYGCEAVIERLA
jgi:hypothetical protein